MRLHKLSKDDRYAWQIARLVHGEKKYKDSHLQRYNLVDVAEELLDAKNILHKFHDRLTKQKKYQIEEVNVIHREINKILDRLQEIDKSLTDDMVTDEQGGERIWWND